MYVRTFVCMCLCVCALMITHGVMAICLHCNELRLLELIDDWESIILPAGKIHSSCITLEAFPDRQQSVYKTMAC